MLWNPPPSFVPLLVSLWLSFSIEPEPDSRNFVLDKQHAEGARAHLTPDESTNAVPSAETVSGIFGR